MHARARTPWIMMFAILCGCATGGTGEAPASRSEDIAVQAAMLRWLMENNDSALGPSATAFCVGIGTGLVIREPSPALIRALQGTFPRVQGVSSCRWARDAVVGRRVVDDLSGAPALALFVEHPEWSGPDEARIWAEYLERPGHGTGYDCELVRGPEGWRVADCRSGFPR